jgi:large subunit ribosomal protein L18
MNRLDQKSQNLSRRKARIRKIAKGTAERPRLSIFISNLHVSAQIINDDTNATLAAVTTISSKEAKGTMTEKAAWVGSEIAKKAKTAKIEKVVFDRNGRLYHGRIKALADAAREGGLEF